MPERATEGAPLEELVALAVPLCQQAEQACPRQGPGRKPEIPDWVLMVMIMVGVMLRKKTKSAQFIWWTHHREVFARWLPGQRLPARSTFYDRYRRVHRRFRQAIQLQGHDAVKRGWADARCLAVDKSLIAGRGRRWSPRDRRRGEAPRRVDRDTTWGYSKYDGWVQGYSYEVAVTAPHRGVVWPLLASVDTASRSEQKSVREKVPALPAPTRYVLADAGYDGNPVAEAVEWDQGRRTGRRFLCPAVPRPNTGRPRQPHSRQSRERQHHRGLREARLAFLRSPRGKALYARRKTRAEPFNARLKHLFDLHERVWHWGLDNNRTMILAAICAYQLLLAYNHRRGRPYAHLQRLLDRL
jgi:hypothetical protein